MYGNYEFLSQSQYDHFIHTLEESVGKLLLCRVDKESPTRYFIHKFDRFLDREDRYRNGWYNVFCISRTRSTEGYYICHIDKLDYDGELHPMFKVTPIFNVTEEMLDDQHLINMFSLSHLFAYEDFADYGVLLNIWEAERHLRDQIPANTDKNISVAVAELAVNQLISGKLDYALLRAWLHTPSPEAIASEQRSREIRTFFVLRADNSMVFPLIFERYDRVGGDPENFIEDLCSKYEVAVQRELIPPTKGLFRQIESYLKFDNDRKAANKAKKTAAKKAKKKGNKNEL